MGRLLQPIYFISSNFSLGLRRQARFRGSRNCQTLRAFEKPKLRNRGLKERGNTPRWESSVGALNGRLKARLFAVALVVLARTEFTCAETIILAHVGGASEREIIKRRERSSRRRIDTCDISSVYAFGTDTVSK